MAGIYAQEAILITNQTVAVPLSHSIWWYLGCEADGIYAEILVEYQNVLFTIDGSDPYAKHCLYGLQYVNQAFPGDVVKLENINEIAGFRAIKETEHNSRISIIYYKS